MPTKQPPSEFGKGHDKGKASVGSYAPRVQPPDKVNLRDVETGHIRPFFVIDAKEVLAGSDRYQPADEQARHVLRSVLPTAEGESNAAA